MTTNTTTNSTKKAIESEFDHAVIFVYGNRNYGRIIVREGIHFWNGTELYWSTERGTFA